MRPLFCCYICICCLKFHQADYQVEEFFVFVFVFTSIWWGSTQLQCIYYLCRILISRPPKVFRRFKRRSCSCWAPCGSGSRTHWEGGWQLKRLNWAYFIRKYHAIWRCCGESPFLHLKLCQPGGRLCHTLGINVSRRCLLNLSRFVSLFQGTMAFELCTILLYSFVHLFIPPLGFMSLLMVLGKNGTDFGGSIQKWTLQLSPSWLNAICSIDSSTSSVGHCSCSSNCFYIEGQLELARSCRVPQLLGADVRFTRGCEWGIRTLPWGTVWRTPHEGWFPRCRLRYFFNRVVV